jgi:DNA polymerase-3 subunit delta
MAREDPLAELEQGEPGPLYFLFGKEPFLVDRAVDILKARVLDPRTRDFNYELVQGKELTAQRVLSAVRTLPMMAKRRLVLLRNVDEAKADELNGLIPYLAKPNAETCLVLTGEKADQRLKFVGAFKKAGAMIKLDPLYERQLAGFVQSEAQRAGVRIEPAAAQLVCDEIGADLGQLADAIERLAVYVGDRKKVAVADVEEVVATTRQRTVFELCDAVGQRKRERALLVLGSITAARESGVRVVSMLARHVRQLATARTLLAQRLNKFEMASALGMPPFFVDGITDQARRLDGTQLGRMHDALYRADLDLKSSRIPDDNILERLILELTA